MESEKKTKRPIKKVFSGPMIQYKSTRMPVIEEMNSSEKYVSENKKNDALTIHSKHNF